METPSEYSSLVIDHFERPRNSGRLPPGRDVVVARAGSRDQGAEFEIHARLAHGRIAAIGIAVFGCPHCIAAASVTSEQLAGLDAEQVERWTWRDVAGTLAVPAPKRGRLLILEDAVHRLGASMRHGT